MHPDDFDRVVAAWQQAVTTGGGFSAELRIRKKDGRYAWILTNAAPLRASDGSVVRWYGTAVDIDKAKRIAEDLSERESMLADSERRFRVLGEAIPVICWTADASGYLDWYNHRWYEYTGQTPEEAAGRGWQAAHHPEDFLEVMRAWPESIATGKPFEMEFRLRRHGGVYHWFLTRIEPLRDANGRIVRWYGSNIDIQAQKQAVERTKRIAETLQDIFLPKQLPQRATLRLDAVYLPAEKDALVGGDWFDAFELPDKRMVLSIGDVAGHGLQASVIVGRLRQAIFTLANREADPAVVLQETDRILQQQEPDTLVTALVGFLYPDQSVLRYASAGQPAPLIANSNEPNESKLRTALGLMVGNTTVARPAQAVQEIVFDDKPTKDAAALLLLQFSSIGLAPPQSDPAALTRMWRFHSSDAYTAHKSRHEIIAYLRGSHRTSSRCSIASSSSVRSSRIPSSTRPGWWSSHRLERREAGLDGTRYRPGLRGLNSALPRDILDENGRGIFLIKAARRGRDRETVARLWHRHACRAAAAAPKLENLIEIVSVV